MKKIILKAKLADRDNFEDKLGEINLDFPPIYWQHDRVYVPRSYKPNSNYPRLVMRTEMKAVDEPPKYYFILKRHIEDSSIDIVEETAVENYEEIVNIILQLGFKLAKEVSRRRQTIKIDETSLIHLDQVEHLPGYYAKIESTLSDGNFVAEAKTKLQEILTTAGETDLVESAYFEM